MLDYYNSKNETNRTPSQQAGDGIKTGGMLNYYNSLSEEEKKKRIQAQNPKPTVAKPSIAPTSTSTPLPKKQETGGFNLNSLVETIKKAVISAIPQLAPKANLPTSAGTPSQILTPTQPLKTLESSPTQQQPLSATLTPSVTQQPNGLVSSIQTVTKNLIDNELRKKNYEPIIFDPNYKYQQSKATLDWTDKIQEIQDKPEDTFLPFVKDAKIIPEILRLNTAVDNMRQGKTTPEDAQVLKQYYMKEKQNKSFGYQVLDVISQSIPFAEELFLTKGTYTTAKTATQGSIKFLASKVGKELLEKDMEKFGMKVATGIIARTATLPIAGSVNITANTLKNQIDTKMASTDYNKPEPLFKSFVKAAGARWVDTLSEFSGEVVTKVASDLLKLTGKGVSKVAPEVVKTAVKETLDSITKLSVPLQNKLLSSTLYKAVVKLNQSKTNAQITQIFKDVGYDGMFKEMLEERVADIGQGVLYKLGYGYQPFKIPSVQQLLVEAVAFAVPGLGGTALSAVLPGTVMTPQQAKTQAEGTDLKGTPAGEAIAKATQQAETEGKNIKIEIVESSEGAITTPGGTNIKVSVVDDKAPIQQFTGEELKKMTPEEKQTVDLTQLASQYPDVKKALDNAGIKIEQPSTPQGGVVITNKPYNFKYTSDQTPETGRAIVVDGKVVGGIGTGTAGEGGTWIDNIEIDPQYRNQGIGKAVIQQIQKDGQVIRGYAESPDAIQFFKKLGAEVDSEGNFTLSQPSTPQGGVQTTQQGRFHGTSYELSKIPSANEGDMFGSQNIYGQGFYTTDNIGVAGKYSKKGSGGSQNIYNITEKSNVRIYNIEKPMDASLLKEINNSVNEGESYKEGTTLKEVYDDIRDRSAGGEFSADTGQEYMAQIEEILTEKGFRGIEHTSNLKDGNIHNVIIYWNPNEDLNYSKLSQPSTQPTLTKAQEYVRSKKTKFRSSLKLPSLSEEVKSKLNKIAIKEYGLTNYNESVGYITPEGKGIDSSGIRQGSGSQGRNVDHREIAESALGDNRLDTPTDSMNLFMKETGNIRVVSAVNDMNMEIPIDNGMPTKKQIDKLRQMTGDMKVFYDISVNGNFVNTGEAKNFNDFYKDLVDTVKSEEKIKESIKNGNIPENLKPLAKLAKESNTFESFMEKLFTDKGRAITNKAFVFGEKVYADYGYKNSDDFYERVKKQELFRIKDDFKRATGITITNKQEAEIIKLNKEIFGDEDVKITEQILSNSQALGSYNERMIKILGGQADAKDTYYHESVHKYLDIALSEQEHVEMLEIAAKQYGLEDFSQVEEKVAEDFINYAKNREGVVGKLKLLFDKLLLRINKFLKNRNRIDELYNDILTGQAKKIIAAQPKTIEETRQIMEEYFSLIEEGTQELNAQLAENERITTELRGLSGDNLKDISTIKRMANTKEGQEGDIETLYKKSPVLTSRVVNAIMIARKDYDLNTNMTDEEAILIALSLPAKKDIRVGTNEKIKQANRLVKEAGIKITEDYTTEQSFSDFERQFNEANQDLPGVIGESKLTSAAASRIYGNIGKLKSVEKKIKASQISATEQLPVGTGTEQKSAAYERIKERLTQEVEKDVNYNKLNLEQDVQNALTFITNSPQAALRVGLGLEQPPAGQTETSISIALADKAFRDGDIKLMARLESSRSRRQTRRGQEIVAERGRFNENSPHTFIKEVMDRRLKDLGSNLEGALARVKGRAKSVKEAAILQIDENVAKIKRKINIERYKIKSAQEIIDSLICK